MDYITTDTTPTKHCPKCDQHKPASDEFFWRRKTSKDGFLLPCKVCRSNPDHPRHKILTCATCGKQFRRKLSQLSGDKDYYCNLQCAGEGYKKHHTGENSVHYNSIHVKCDQCGETFARRESHTTRRENHFCSTACMGKWKTENLHGENSPHYNRVPTYCRQCGAEFTLIPRAFNSEGNFCNRKCLGLWMSANKTGPNNPLWKGGRLPYYGPDWPAQRRKARKRDNNTCQHCGKTAAKFGKNMHVHHIKPFREFPADCSPEANHLTNLICLCARCHILAEHGKILLRPKLL